jgi:hypothetical protein
MQEHSAGVGTVELQQDGQMPVARLKLWWMERRTEMILGMIHYHLALLVATKRSI